MKPKDIRKGDWIIENNGFTQQTYFVHEVRTDTIIPFMSVKKKPEDDESIVLFFSKKIRIRKQKKNNNR